MRLAQVVQLARAEIEADDRAQTLEVVEHLAKVALGERNTVVSDQTVTLQAHSDIYASAETDITSGGAVTFHQSGSGT